MVKRSGRKNALHSSEKVAVLSQRQPAHQHCARVDLLMRRLRRKLGKEIHRPNPSYRDRRRKSEYIATFDPVETALVRCTRFARSRPLISDL